MAWTAPSAHLMSCCWLPLIYVYTCICNIQIDMASRIHVMLLFVRKRPPPPSVCLSVFLPLQRTVLYVLFYSSQSGNSTAPWIMGQQLKNQLVVGESTGCEGCSMPRGTKKEGHKNRGEKERETAKCCYYWTWIEWEIIATWFSHSMIMKSITHRSLLLDKGLWRFFFRRILDLPLHSFIYFIRDAQLHSLHYYCWRSFSKWGNSISFLYFPGRTNGGGRDMKREKKGPRWPAQLNN